MPDQERMERIRRMITFAYAPLLDTALSLLVLLNPERFGTKAPWIGRVEARLPEGLLDSLRDLSYHVDLFALAMEPEDSPEAQVPEALTRMAEQHPDLAKALSQYWEAVAPEIGALTGLLVASIQRERERLEQMDPLAFICRFSDRVSVAGDGDSIVLHWGKGMQVPLADLDRILFVPSAFCPRRLMFYRLGRTQIFFYNPTEEEPSSAEEVPESLILGFNALADATRLKLLRLIATESLPAQEMAQRLGVNQSTVSRHLRMLVEAGLIGRDHQEGRYLFYSVQINRIDELAASAKRYLRR